MKQITWRLGCGGGLCLTLLVTSCASNEQAAQPTAPQDATAQQATQALQNAEPQSFPSPDIPAPSRLNPTPPAPIATIPVKGLTQSTPAAQRVVVAKTGLDRDPFAPLMPTQITVIPSPSQPSALRSKSQSTSQSASTAAPAKPTTARDRSFPTRFTPSAPPPTLTLKPLPPVPSFAPPVTISPLPPMQVPMQPIAPPISPTRLAEEVEITGVAQVGDRLMVIVKAPDESTARYVQQGDYLSGGQVQLKAIRMSAQGEPTVILRQAGRDVIKSLGRNQAAGLNSTRFGSIR